MRMRLIYLLGLLAFASVNVEAAGAVADFSTGSGISTSSNITINYPTTVNAGEGLFVILTTDSSDNMTFPGIWDIGLIVNTGLSTATK